MSELAGYARYAIYWAPPRGSMLARAGDAWLGWDAEAGVPVKQPSVGLDLAAHTRAARRYGFHATLKAPFRLAADQRAEGLDLELKRFAAREPAFRTHGLSPSLVRGFLALSPIGPTDALDALAARAVMRFDDFRAELTAEEIAHRDPSGMTTRQARYFARWGYPSVFEEFDFHVTLSGAVAGLEAFRLANLARTLFAPVLRPALEISEICLFGDPGHGQPFRLLRRYALTG